jgi:uncharacterized protein (DUF302 family)
VYVCEPVAAEVVILLDAELLALLPAEFVAYTVNVYEVLGLSPETVIVPEPAVARLPVIPPGEDTAV